MRWLKGGASSQLLAMLREKKTSHMLPENFGDKLIRYFQLNYIKYAAHKDDINSAIRSLKK